MCDLGSSLGIGFENTRAAGHKRECKVARAVIACAEKWAIIRLAVGVSARHIDKARLSYPVNWASIQTHALPRHSP